MPKNENDSCMFGAVITILAFAYLFGICVEHPWLASPDVELMVKLFYFAPAIAAIPAVIFFMMYKPKEK